MILLGFIPLGKKCSIYLNNFLNLPGLTDCLWNTSLKFDILLCVPGVVIIAFFPASSFLPILNSDATVIFITTPI